MSQTHLIKTADGPMYRALISKNPAKRNIAKSIISLSKVFGSQERVKMSNIKNEELRKRELKKFLEEDSTQTRLNAINVSPKLFKVAVLSNYIYDLSDFKKAFEKLIRYAVGKEINNKQIDDITKRMANDSFKLQDTDFLSEYDIQRQSPRLREFRDSGDSDDDIRSKSTLKSISDSDLDDLQRLSNEVLSGKRLSDRRLSKLKIDNRMMIRSLPDIANISPFSPFPSKLGQGGGGGVLRLQRSIKRRSVKRRSKSRK